MRPKGKKCSGCFSEEKIYMRKREHSVFKLIKGILILAFATYFRSCCFLYPNDGRKQISWSYSFENESSITKWTLQDSTWNASDQGHWFGVIHASFTKRFQCFDEQKTSNQWIAARRDHTFPSSHRTVHEIWNYRRFVKRFYQLNFER